MLTRSTSLELRATAEAEAADRTEAQPAIDWNEMELIVPPEGIDPGHQWGQLWANAVAEASAVVTDDEPWDW